jgi:hypothetical protein
MIMPTPQQEQLDAALLASLSTMRRSLFVLLAALLTILAGFAGVLSAVFTLVMGIASFFVWALSVGRLYLDSALLWAAAQGEMRYTI